MTINLANNDPRVSYAVAESVTQTSFTVPFEFFVDADLNVYVDGTLKTLTTDYTVTGGDGSTGTVTISVTGASGGSTVVITRTIDLERTTDFPTSGPFDVNSLNTELDKQVAMIADLKDKTDRALQLTDFDADVSLVLPDVDTRKGKTLAFNASTGAVEAGPSIGDVQTVSAASADIATLADIEDGTDATDTIQTVAGIASNVTTVAGVSADVTTVAGQTTNLQNVTDNLSAIQNAASNATAAETAKTAAEAAQTAAELAADNFGDIYLGAKASNPTLDNDGDALTAGDLYFNTTDNQLKVYTGSAWVAAAVTAADFLTVSNNLSDLGSAATARTNLGLGTAATTASTDYATAAQGALADSALQSADIGVSVQAYDADTAKLDVAQTFTAAQSGSTDTDTTNTGNVTLDFSTNQNFVLTLTGNVTLDNPTTETVGQSGFITFIQDATGGRTVSLGTDYETAGAAGLTLSSTASTTDIVPYVVVASGRILLGAPQLAFA
jgi:hypothetical protein